MGKCWWLALVSPDGVAPSWMVGVSASVNLPLHHKVQTFSSGTGSPGWSLKKGRKWLWWCGGVLYHSVWSRSLQFVCLLIKSDESLFMMTSTDMLSSSSSLLMTFIWCKFGVHEMCIQNAGESPAVHSVSPAGKHGIGSVRRRPSGWRWRQAGIPGWSHCAEGLRHSDVRNNCTVHQQWKMGRRSVYIPLRKG